MCLVGNARKKEQTRYVFSTTNQTRMCLLRLGEQTRMCAECVWNVCGLCLVEVLKISKRVCVWSIDNRRTCVASKRWEKQCKRVCVWCMDSKRVCVWHLKQKNAPKFNPATFFSSSFCLVLRCRGSPAAGFKKTFVLTSCSKRACTPSTTRSHEAERCLRTIFLLKTNKSQILLRFS